MQVFADIEKMQSYLEYLQEEGFEIGFAPTMGALHQGHMSLIDQIHSREMVSVCSIFVNPTQFNEKSDLDKYPRVLREDLTMLEQYGCDVVFIPEVDSVYPSGLDTAVYIDRDGLDRGMEGKFRPGHFDGMLQVVNRLLELVKPDAIFMGQKDYQQFALVQHMASKLHPTLSVVMCPIIREADGLAMSSRNRRLTPEWKTKALVISQTLNWARENLDNESISELQSEARQGIEAEGIRPEYLDIVDGTSLVPVKDASDHEIIVACVAAWAGEIRLIDNMILRSAET